MSLSVPLLQMLALFDNGESQWKRSKLKAASKCSYWYLMLFPGTRVAVFGDLAVPLGIARCLDDIY